MNADAEVVFSWPAAVVATTKPIGILLDVFNDFGYKS
jgi:hypothetical protein